MKLLKQKWALEVNDALKHTTKTYTKIHSPALVSMLMMMMLPLTLADWLAMPQILLKNKTGDKYGQSKNKKTDQGQRTTSEGSDRN